MRRRRRSGIGVGDGIRQFGVVAAQLARQTSGGGQLCLGGVNCAGVWRGCPIGLGRVCDVPVVSVSFWVPKRFIVKTFMCCIFSLGMSAQTVQMPASLECDWSSEVSRTTSLLNETTTAVRHQGRLSVSSTQRWFASHHGYSPLSMLKKHSCRDSRP